MLLDLQFLLDNPLWSSEPYTHYQDTIAFRRSISASQQQAFAGPPAAELIAEFLPDTTFSDWLAPLPGLRAHQQQAFAANTAPERTQLLASEVHPDFVLRPVYLASNQLAITSLSPFPEQQQNLDWQPNYPERALRTLTPTNAHLVFAAPVQPEERLQLDWDPCYPDRALRAWMLAAERPFFAAPTQPEERIQLDWTPSYPERALRLQTPANAHLFFATSPQPEEKIQLDWEPNYPERALRAVEHASQQPYLALEPFPRPSLITFGFTYYPDFATRPRFPTTEHQFYAANITPERASPLASTWHPDRIDRPFLSSANQLAVTQISPKPERVAPLAAEVHPDFVLRPFYLASNQPFVTGISPQPEEQKQLDWDPYYPDRASKAWLLTAEQPTFALAPKPEERIDLDWQPSYPERALRAVLPVAHYQAFVLFPKPERNSPLFSEVHADQVLRPFYATANQLAITGLSPKPEEQKQLDWDPSFPERALRSWMSAAEHMFHALDVSPRPDVPSAGLSCYPDRIIRAFLPVAAMPAFVASQQPERTSTLFSEQHPDRVWRPFYPTTEQPFVTGLSPKPEDKQDLDWNPSYPDRAIRAAGLAASRQLFVTEVYPRPEEKVQLDWKPTYPDRTIKLWLGTALQLFVTEVEPRPEEKIDLDWNPSYPERALRRASLAVSSQLAYSAPAAPPAPPNFIELIYPDAVARPFFRVASQLAATEMELQPIAPVGGPPAFMSTSVGRANQLGAGVGKSVGLSVFVSRGNGLNASIGKFTSLTVRIGKA